MKTIKLSKGAINSISVYDSDICRTIGKPRRKKSEVKESSCNVEHNTIQHNATHVRKRNHAILKTLGQLAVKHQCFLTLQSTISDPIIFRRNFDRFASWFKRKYENGWLFYCFECSVTGNIHAHVFVHLGTENFDLESFKNICWRKWTIINFNPDEKFVEVTQFNVKQYGYVASRTKYNRSISLLDMFQTSQTFGFINKKNAKFVEKYTYKVSDKILELINQFILSKINKYDFKMNRIPSYVQINKIIHFGAYSQHGLTLEDVIYLNVLLYWEELIELYGVADPAIFDDLPEWPSDLNHVEDDEEPIFRPGDDDAIDGYMATLQEA